MEVVLLLKPFHLILEFLLLHLSKNNEFYTQLTDIEKELQHYKEHLKDIKKERIGLIDLVVVNLYPFEKTVDSGKSFEEVIENIDIGGPSLLRAAAKNYQDVVVLSNPDKYGLILKEMKENDGQIKEETAYRLACEVFLETSFYDGIIHSYLKGEMSLRTEGFPEKKTLL